MAGNVLVVKHASCVPQCAIAFQRLLLDAGAPVGAYTNLLISHEQSDRAIDDPRVKGVALTGSVAAGRRGQTCCAAKRFIVLDAIADQFLAKFKTALEVLKPGDPMDEQTTHGPLSTEAALAQLLPQLDAAVKRGAKLLMGGKRIVASQVDTGMMFVNNLDWADAELPFGGIKHSGYGRELGNMGIQEFVNKKLVRTAHMAAPV